jgi:hypothetical protein
METIAYSFVHLHCPLVVIDAKEVLVSTSIVTDRHLLTIGRGVGMVGRVEMLK